MEGDRQSKINSCDDDSDDDGGSGDDNNDDVTLLPSRTTAFAYLCLTWIHE